MFHTVVKQRMQCAVGFLTTILPRNLPVKFFNRLRFERSMVMSLAVAPLFWPTLYNELPPRASTHGPACPFVCLSHASWSSTKMAKRTYRIMPTVPIKSRPGLNSFMTPKVSTKFERGLS